MEEKKGESQFDPETEFEPEGGKFKQWFQDNLRIIVSVIVVSAIAIGIYSYSNRIQDAGLITDEETAGDISTDLDGTEDDGTVEVGGESPTTGQDQPGRPGTTPVTSAQETETSFIESAQPGNGVTHLARRALANHLEKNPDSQLTPEHKIYIEDFLRKNVDFSGRVFVGTTVEFQKELIRQAIEKSKTLNDAQLKNLEKYSRLVPSLT